MRRMARLRRRRRISARVRRRRWMGSAIHNRPSFSVISYIVCTGGILSPGQDEDDSGGIRTPGAEGGAAFAASGRLPVGVCVGGGICLLGEVLRR